MFASCRKDPVTVPEVEEADQEGSGICTRDTASHGYTVGTLNDIGRRDIREAQQFFEEFFRELRRSVTLLPLRETQDADVVASRSVFCII